MTGIDEKAYKAMLDKFGIEQDGRDFSLRHKFEAYESAKAHHVPADDRALVENVANAIRDMWLRIPCSEIGANPGVAWKDLAAAAISIVQSHTAAQNEKLREIADNLQLALNADGAGANSQHVRGIYRENVTDTIATIEQLIKGE